MQNLKTFTGKGLLLHKGQECGPIDYTLNVFVVANRKDGAGEITGDSALFEELADHPDVVLRLEGGQEVAIVMVNIEGDRAVIKTSGPILPSVS